jgi:hypothetical protein
MAAAELGVDAEAGREKVVNAAREFFSNDLLDGLHAELLPFAPFGH